MNIANDYFPLSLITIETAVAVAAESGFQIRLLKNDMGSNLDNRK